MDADPQEDQVDRHEQPRERLRWTSLFRSAARLNLTRPFSTLLLISVLVTLVSSSFSEPSNATLLAWIVLYAIEIYIDIAVILAAAEHQPDPSGDRWLRAAFRRRVFWRYFLISFAVFLVTSLGFVLLIVPGLIVAGRWGLAQTAAVLDARKETRPIARSIELTEPARSTVAILFGVFLILPVLGLTVAENLSDGLGSWALAISLILLILARITAIALAKAYVALGGVVRERVRVG